MNTEVIEKNIRSALKAVWSVLANRKGILHVIEEMTPSEKQIFRKHLSLAIKPYVPNEVVQKLKYKQDEKTETAIRQKFFLMNTAWNSDLDRKRSRVWWEEQEGPKEGYTVEGACKRMALFNFPVESLKSELTRLIETGQIRVLDDQMLSLGNRLFEDFEKRPTVKASDQASEAAWELVTSFSAFDRTIKGIELPIIEDLKNEISHQLYLTVFGDNAS